MEIRNQQNESKYKRLVEKTSKTAKKLEENELMDFLQLYQNIVEYRVLDNMNDDQDKTLTERRGKMICKTYIENIDTVKVKWHQLLIENHLIEK